MWKKALIPMFLVLAACATGNRYDYQSEAVVLPLKADKPMGVVLYIEDLRPYVKSGEKSADFVGLQRGGFGNPFEVTTTSGRPMAEDMQASVAAGLRNSGYDVSVTGAESDLAALTVTARQHEAMRILWLRVREWKSDIYMGIRLDYDLNLKVYDVDGTLLAENTMQGSGPVGGMKLSQGRNSQHMAQEFSKRIGYLFNDPSVRGAL